MDFQYYTIFENMAIDEAILLQTIKTKKPPTIRFYGSQPKAITIGYFQDARKEVNIEACRKTGVDIARRITGGKAVLHDHEITYCLVAADQEKIFPSSIEGTYKVISRCLARGLGFLGIKANLAEDSRTGNDDELKSCCFAIPSKNELLVDGRKICGSAQVRKRGGFLQHGSLLLSFDPFKAADLLLHKRAQEYSDTLKKSIAAVNEESVSPYSIQEVCRQLQKGFTTELGIELVQETLTPAEEIMKNELMGKYTDSRWNMERGKKF